MILLTACAVHPAQAQSYSSGQMMFHGYACPEDDCSGHEAGYAWAQEQNILLGDDCANPSAAAVEGCLAWVEEQQNGATAPAIKPVELPENGYYE